jgi:tetratricopeptide (TPR) repeat protein
MDVNHACGSARILGALVALTVGYGAAAADDSIAEANDQPSTLVVTASDGGEMLQQPAAIAGSELIIREDDSVEPTAFAESTDDSAQGTLTVVANSQRKGPVSAIKVDSQVVPASTSWGNMLAGPRRPGATAGIQTRHSNIKSSNKGMNYQRTAPQAKSITPSAKVPRTAQRQVDNQTTGAERLAAALVKKKAAPAPAASSAPTALPAEAGSQLLVEAYQRSLSASSEAEYSQIVRSCAEAMRQGLEGENRKFALELSGWALNRRGQVRLDQGQHDTAVADFRAALEFDPKCWRALHNRGVTLAQSGKFAEAFDDMTAVIQLNPQFAKAYSNRATLYVQAGDFEKAIADYKAALAIDPALSAALIGRGRVCHMTGRLEEALESFNAAIAQDDANAETVCSRGDLLVDLGRYSEALADYTRAIDLDPKFEHAYRNGAWLLATCPDDSIRDADGAIKGAEAALNCGYGERHAALDTLAAALANAGRFEEAVGTLQQAIEIAPEEAVPAYQARQQLYESGQPFRTHPVGEEVPGDDVQEVEFVEG